MATRRAISMLVVMVSTIVACGGDSGDNGDEAVATETSDSAGAAATTGADATTGASDATASTGTTAGGGTEATEAEFDPNGSLVFGLTVAPRNMDPHTANGIGDLPALVPVYDRLIEYTFDGEYEPMLAESWEFSDDGSVLELELRTDVTFHDGTPFDAAAVKANIERGLTHPRSNVKGFLSPIESVEVVDPATVRLHVTPGEAYGLLSALSLLPGMMISPTAMDKPDLDQYGVGTGPYVIKEGTFSPNDRATFVRAPGEYWAGPERQRLAEFEQVRFADAVTAENALRSGEIDVSMVPDAIQMEQIAADGGFEVRLAETLNPTGVKFNLEHEAVSDVRVRQAIAQALDRETLVDTVLAGTCTPTPVYQYIAEGNPGHVAELDELYPYDPEEAQALLAEAGAERLQISGMNVSPSDQFQIAVQAQLQAVGINQTLDTMSSTDANPAWNAGTYDAWAWPIVTTTDPALVLQEAAVEHFQLHETTDNVTTAAAGLLDQTKTEEERAEIMAATNTAAVEDVISVPVCFVQSRAIAREGVLGLDDQPFLSIQSLLDSTRFATAASP